jgi:hypothetical protein
VALPSVALRVARPVPSSGGVSSGSHAAEVATVMTPIFAPALLENKEKKEEQVEEIEESRRKEQKKRTGT